MSTPEHAVHEHTLDAETADGPMAVVVAEPAEAPADGTVWPTVLIFIDAPGLRPATREYMARLASHGYRVITPDLHHRHGRLLHFEPKDSSPENQKTIWAWIASMTDDQIQHDAEVALTAAGVPSDAPFGVIGFCLGARAVYRSMERNPERARCGAGWHPSFLADDKPDSPHLSAGQLDRPLYLGIGEDDEIQSIAMHQPFLDAVADLAHVEVVTFAGTDHGFSWPGYPSYNETAAETSWTHTLGMLKAAL